MPGVMWHQGFTGEGAEGRILVNKSLGRVFSSGYVASNSKDAINNTVRPHLNAILATSLDEVIPYKDSLQDLANGLDDLAHFSLWVAQYDLNDRMC